MMSREALTSLIAAAEGAGIRFISDEIYHGLDYAFPADDRGGAFAARARHQFVLEIFLHDRLAGRLDGGAGAAGAADRAAAAESCDLGADAVADRRRSCVRGPRGDGSRQARLSGEPPHPDRGPAARPASTKFLPADGAFYLYADVSAFTSDSFEFAKRMLEQAHVAATPGIDFDPVHGRQFIRFSYARSADDMREAVARIARWLG